MNKQQNTTIKCKSSCLYVSYNVTDNVTKDVTSIVTNDVTNSSDINNGITLCESDKCRKAETSLVTYGVTNNVTHNVTAKEEKKKRKKKFPLHPLKKKKNKKRRKTPPLTCARVKKPEKEFQRHYICLLENKHLFLHSIIKPTLKEN